MNYRQQLIHEAVQELKADPVWAPKLAHVTDISCDWQDKRADVVYLMVYDGQAFTIRKYRDMKTWDPMNMSLWGLKKIVEIDEQKRKNIIKYVKDNLTQTLEHAEKTSADRRGFSDIYPGLAL